MTQKSNHKELRLSSFDGVKDIKVRHASVEARENRDFSKDGSAMSAEYEGSLDDVKARAERYGLDIDHSGDIGAGLA